MTVFAVHENKDDISAARGFGEIRFINRYYIHGDELEPVPDNTTDLRIPRGYAANMERAVAEFDPLRDFLLIQGDHLQLLAFTAMLAARHGTFSVLRWDRQVRSYIPIRLSSGIVPPRAGVLASGTDIGDRNAIETRQNASAVALESPVLYDKWGNAHRDRPKRTS